MNLYSKLTPKLRNHPKTLTGNKTVSGKYLTALIDYYWLDAMTLDSWLLVGEKRKYTFQS